MDYHELLKPLKTEIEKATNIVTGQAIQSFEQYKYYVGYIQGLEKAIYILQEKFKVNYNYE